MECTMLHAVHSAQLRCSCKAWAGAPPSNKSGGVEPGFEVAMSAISASMKISHMDVLQATAAMATQQKCPLEEAHLCWSVLLTVNNVHVGGRAEGCAHGGPNRGEIGTCVVARTSHRLGWTNNRNAGTSMQTTSAESNLCAAQMGGMQLWRAARGHDVRHHNCCLPSGLPGSYMCWPLGIMYTSYVVYSCMS